MTLSKHCSSKDLINLLSSVKFIFFLCLIESKHCLTTSVIKFFIDGTPFAKFNFSLILISVDEIYSLMKFLTLLRCYLFGLILLSFRQRSQMRGFSNYRLLFLIDFYAKSSQFEIGFNYYVVPTIICDYSPQFG